MRIIFLAPLFTLTVATKLLAQANVNFYREEIDFMLNETYFTVNGFYYFRNNTNRNVEELLFYPFPEKVIEHIDSIAIFTMYGKNLQYKRAGNGLTFNIKILAFDSCFINIIYREKHNKTTVTYILTSTQVWNQPLVQCDYSFCTDEKVYIKNFAYKPDKQIGLNNNKLYFWKKRSFMPQKEFEVNFSVK